jgi:hypothetical protein
MARKRTQNLPPKPKPRPKPEIVKVEPANPGGRTDDEMLAAIARAIAYINERKQAHGDELAEELGEYLLVDVYCEDLEYLSKHDPGRTNSLRDIAAGTLLSHTTLDKYINVAIYKRLTGTEDIEICMSAMAQVGRLAHRLDAALAIARWTERDGITVDRLRRAVTYWIKQLDREHRPLIELVRAPDPPGPSPQPKPRKVRLKPTELCVVDVLLIMREMVETRYLHGRARSAALARVRQLRRMLLERKRRP